MYFFKKTEEQVYFLVMNNDRSAFNVSNISKLKHLTLAKIMDLDM